MFFRMVYESFRRQKRRKLLAGVAVTLGVAVATAMIGVATDIGDKISRELRSYGANLVVTPQEDTVDVEIGGVNLKPPSDGAFLNEADLPKIKEIFWRNNIVGFAPMLLVNVKVGGPSDTKVVTLLGTYFSKRLKSGTQEFVTGVRITNPWWKVQGSWPDDNSNEVLLGERLAAKLHRRPGDRIDVNGRELRIAGIHFFQNAENLISDGQVTRPFVVGRDDVPRRVMGRTTIDRVFVSLLIFGPKGALF